MKRRILVATTLSVSLFGQSLLSGVAGAQELPLPNLTEVEANLVIGEGETAGQPWVVWEFLADALLGIVGDEEADSTRPELAVLQIPRALLEQEGVVLQRTLDGETVSVDLTLLGEVDEDTTYRSGVVLADLQVGALDEEALVNLTVELLAAGHVLAGLEGLLELLAAGGVEVDPVIDPEEGPSVEQMTLVATYLSLLGKAGAPGAGDEESEDSEDAEDAEDIGTDLVTVLISVAPGETLRLSAPTTGMDPESLLDSISGEVTVHLPAAVDGVLDSLLDLIGGVDEDTDLDDLFDDIEDPGLRAKLRALLEQALALLDEAEVVESEDPEVPDSVIVDPEAQAVFLESLMEKLGPLLDKQTADLLAGLQELLASGNGSEDGVADGEADEENAEVEEETDTEDGNGAADEDSDTVDEDEVTDTEDTEDIEDVVQEVEEEVDTTVKDSERIARIVGAIGAVTGILVLLEALSKETGSSLGSSRDSTGEEKKEGGLLTRLSSVFGSSSNAPAAKDESRNDRDNRDDRDDRDDRDNRGGLTFQFAGTTGEKTPVTFQGTEEEKKMLTALLGDAKVNEDGSMTVEVDQEALRALGQAAERGELPGGQAATDTRGDRVAQSPQEQAEQEAAEREAAEQAAGSAGEEAVTTQGAQDSQLVNHNEAASEGSLPVTGASSTTAALAAGAVLLLVMGGVLLLRENRLPLRLGARGTRDTGAQE